MLGFLSTAFALLFIDSVFALPTLHDKRAATQLSSTQLSSYAPFTQLARAAYCASSKLTNWDCGGMLLRLHLVLDIDADDSVQRPAQPCPGFRQH